MTRTKLLGIAVTPKGRELLQTLTGVEILEPVADLKTQIAKVWAECDGIVFCLAAGAVVRLIAPLLKDKATDPAIVVMDEAGKFVISLCGGHLGGGDRYTREISAQLGAEPIITSAAERIGLAGIDILGKPFGWQRGTGDWTGVSAAIARQETVQVIQECGSLLWQSHLPSDHPFQFGFPDFPSPTPEVAPQGRVWISHIQRHFAEESDFPKVQWHPRVLWVGIGCERGTSKEVIAQAIAQACRTNHLAAQAIAGIATIDIKADELGILELVKAKNWCLQSFPAAALAQISVPNPSAYVESVVGTPSVAEAAALLAASTTHTSNSLIVPKQVYRQEGEEGAVTVAIAKSSQEYTGRTGNLLLVGIGPGALDQITPAAKRAIASADVVIGYSLYIDLIQPLIHPGQMLEASPITQERQRALRAVTLAQWGLTVAMISSGDCGIYGMAGLVMEELAAQNWNGIAPDVEVFPGITALQAVASRLGTPLMHDFCAISLSDLFTPMAVIHKRLIAAAEADFVTALYNPRSATRTEPMAIAHQTFLTHRHPHTPVALVKSAYRDQEAIILTTLAELDITQIDMFTTVLIGNASTYVYQGKLITPRAYSTKPMQQYRSLTDINLYDSPTLERLATQMAKGRYLCKKEDQVELLEDGYRGFIRAEDWQNLEITADVYVPQVVSEAEIQERIPQAIAYIHQAMQQSNFYLWGGTVPPNYDCSGLMQAAFKSIGVWIPRDAYQQEAFTTAIAIESLRLGDLIFFGNATKATHVGIYIGEGRYLHSSGKDLGRDGIGLDVLVGGDAISQGYAQQLRGAGRVTCAYNP